MKWVVPLSSIPGPQKRKKMTRTQGKEQRGNFRKPPKEMQRTNNNSIVQQEQKGRINIIKRIENKNPLF